MEEAPQQRRGSRESNLMVRTYSSMPKIGSGVVGLENNRYYCYMNACLQCLIPITQLRDHFIMQEYLNVLESRQRRVKNSFELSSRFHEFYDEVFRQTNNVIRPQF